MSHTLTHSPSAIAALRDRIATVHHNSGNGFSGDKNAWLKSLMQSAVATGKIPDGFVRGACKLHFMEDGTPGFSLEKFLRTPEEANLALDFLEIYRQMLAAEPVPYLGQEPVDTAYWMLFQFLPEFGFQFQMGAPLPEAWGDKYLELLHKIISDFMDSPVRAALDRQHAHWVEFLKRERAAGDGNFGNHGMDFFLSRDSDFMELQSCGLKLFDLAAEAGRRNLDHPELIHWICDFAEKVMSLEDDIHRFQTEESKLEAIWYYLAQENPEVSSRVDAMLERFSVPAGAGEANLVNLTEKVLEIRTWLKAQDREFFAGVFEILNATGLFRFSVEDLPGFFIREAFFIQPRHIKCCDFFLPGNPINEWLIGEDFGIPDFWEEEFPFTEAEYAAAIGKAKALQEKVSPEMAEYLEEFIERVEEAIEMMEPEDLELPLELEKLEAQMLKAGVVSTPMLEIEWEQIMQRHFPESEREYFEAWLETRQLKLVVELNAGEIPVPYDGMLTRIAQRLQTAIPGLEWTFSATPVAATEDTYDYSLIFASEDFGQESKLRHSGDAVDTEWLFGAIRQVLAQSSSGIEWIPEQPKGHLQSAWLVSADEAEKLEQHYPKWVKIPSPQN